MRWTGIVRDMANVPVANAEIALVGGAAGATRYGYTDSEGRYLVEQVQLDLFSMMVKASKARCARRPRARCRALARP